MTDLYQMRKLIDQYAADKGKLPESLEDLVSAGYMREIPTDPITDQKDWPLRRRRSLSTEGGSGIIDVRSAPVRPPSEGTRYSDW